MSSQASKETFLGASVSIFMPLPLYKMSSFSQSLHLKSTLLSQIYFLLSSTVATQLFLTILISFLSVILVNPDYKGSENRDQVLNKWPSYRI